MAKCLNSIAVPTGGNYSTGQMREIVEFASGLNTPGISDAEKQWLVLFARHFIDQFSVAPAA
jgi:hypothetical protein